MRIRVGLWSSLGRKKALCGVNSRGNLLWQGRNGLRAGWILQYLFTDAGLGPWGL